MMENFNGKRTEMARQTEPERTPQLAQAVLIKPGRTGGQTVAPFTRRNFLTTYPAAGVGLGLLAKDARAQNGGGGSSITSNFNGTAIPAGDWIWFTAVFKVHGLGSAPVTIGFMGSIQFSVNGTLYVVAVPSAFVTFSPSVTSRHHGLQQRPMGDDRPVVRVWPATSSLTALLFRHHRRAAFRVALIPSPGRGCSSA